MKSSTDRLAQGSTCQVPHKHVIPHAATFRSSKDVTHGDLQKNLENLRMLQQAKENYVSPRTQLRNRLAHTRSFKQSSPGFIAMLAEKAVYEHLEESQVLYHVGQPCFGESPFYILLEGQMSQENELEVVLGFIYEGEFFGEGGALCLSEERSATMRASKGRPVSLLRIEGSVLEAAVTAYPEERDHIEETYYRRTAGIHQCERRRDHWIHHTVIPFLSSTALFAGCPDDFLYDVAAPLVEKTYKAGQTVAVCGEPADSMLLLLEGAAEIEAKSGAKIGRIKAGYCFGEVAALRLFPCRTATMKASVRCRILQVTAKALKRAIDRSSAEFASAFSHLAESRREQVQKGLPICALPIKANPEDVSVRAVALQAERIDLAPGQSWLPLSDDDSCGSHFGVLVKGKAVLETIEGHRLVTVLTPGMLLPEGIAAEYQTQIRALTRCEGYRVRQNDFLVAVYSVPSAQEWFYRFRLLDKQTRSHWSSRLAAVKGLTESGQHHPSSDYINAWKARRLRAVERARRIHAEEDVEADPLLESSSLSFLSFTSSVSPCNKSKSSVSRGCKPKADPPTSPSEQSCTSLSRPLSRVSSAPLLERPVSRSVLEMSISCGLSDASHPVRLPRLQAAA